MVCCYYYLHYHADEYHVVTIVECYVSIWYMYSTLYDPNHLQHYYSYDLWNLIIRILISVDVIIRNVEYNIYNPLKYFYIYNIHPIVYDKYHNSVLQVLLLVLLLLLVMMVVVVVVVISLMMGTLLVMVMMSITAYLPKCPKNVSRQNWIARTSTTVKFYLLVV